MKILSSGNAAHFLGVCRETVVHYVKRGLLHPFTTVNGRNFFTQEQLEKFINSKNLAPSTKQLKNAA